MTQRGDPKPSHARRPGDDFRKIDGIGRVFEQRLWDAEIFTYNDLARRTPEEIAAILAPMAGTSPEHIASQARELAEPPEASIPRQRIAGFHVEFVLGSDNRVHHTNVLQHHTDVRDTWPGWDPERLLTFLRDGIPLPAVATPADAPDVEPTETRTDESAQTEAGDQEPASVEPAPAGQPSAPAPDRLPPLSLSIEEFGPIRDDQRSRVLSPNEPSSVRLTMRINPIGAPIHDSFDFSATIVARRFAGHDRSPLGTTRGTIRARDPVSVEVTGPALAADLYRLVATVEIYTAGHSPGEPPLHSHRVSGDLMRVADAPLGSAPAVA